MGINREQSSSSFIDEFQSLDAGGFSEITARILASAEMLLNEHSQTGVIIDCSGGL